jgi:phosphoglycerate kinase
VKNIIKRLVVKNKKAFLGVDYNVPIKEGRVADDTMAEQASLPHLLEVGATPILASHLGRLQGQGEIL